MPRERKPSPIYLAWDKIVSGEDKYSLKSQQAWSALWEQHCEGERFTKTSIDDVALLSLLGYDQAIHRGDWQAARLCMERYFEHPRWETDIDSVIPRASLARACWACGDENKALELFGQLAAQAKAWHSLPLLLVICGLLEIYQSQPEEAIASDRLIAFSQRAEQQFAGTRMHLPASVGSTYGELAAVLESAWTARTKPT